jgi:hypothetical protein
VQFRITPFCVPAGPLAKDRALYLDRAFALR